MDRRSLSGIAAFLLALVPCTRAHCQPYAITDTCRGNAVRYALSSVPTTSASPSAGAEFNANPCDPSAVNLFAAWPLYQVEDDGAGVRDARASVFNDSNGQLAAPAIAPAGDSMTLRWSDVDGRGLFAASYRIDVRCCGAQCGQAVHTIDLTNLTANAIRISLYAFVDVDLNDSFGDDRTNPRSRSNRHVIVDDDSCGGSIEFWGDNITNWEIDAFPGVESRLLASGGPLVNTLLPFGPSDYTGAFQWIATLAGGQSYQAVFTLGHNCLQCTSTAGSQSYGIGLGSGGAAPTMSTLDLPTPGCPVRVDVQGPPNSIGTMFIGFGQANLPFPGCQQTLLVLPVAATRQFSTNSAGTGTFTMPGFADPGACGLAVNLQAWFPVGTFVGCFPLVHSAGLELRYGGV